MSNNKPKYLGPGGAIGKTRSWIASNASFHLTKEDDGTLFTSIFDRSYANSETYITPDGQVGRWVNGKGERTSKTNTVGPKPGAYIPG